MESESDNCHNEKEKLAKRGSYPIHPKVDISLRKMIIKWKERPDHQTDKIVTGIIEVRNNAESRAQWERDARLIGIHTENLANGMYSFSSTISSVARFVESDPPYLIWIELPTRYVLLLSIF